MIINQLLFGYNQGHSLLNASIRLPLEDRNLIQQLSDWSDFQNPIDEPTYISGFPLEKSEYFALCRTWYANEMQRPGCAWTHVLLINKQNFELIDNINFILDLFKRPDIKTEFSEYSIPLNIELSNPKVENKYSALKISNNHPLFQFDKGAIKELISYIYVSNKPILIAPTQKNYPIEQLFVRLWWMQHINFRYRFTFCTGSSTPRKYFNRIFDLQIISGSNYRSNCLDLNSMMFKENDNTSWLEYAYNEVISNNNHFITFLNRYSSDIPEDKKEFGYLIDIYQMIKGGLIKPDPESYIIKLLNKLSTYFPTKEEGAKLKEVLLRKEIISSFCEDRFFILLICSINNSSAFDFEGIHIGERILEIYKENKLSYFELLDELQKKEINDLGVTLLSHAAKNVKEADISILTKKFWDLFITLVGLNSRIAYSNYCWEGSKEQNLELITILFQNNNIENGIWVKVLDSILSKEISLPNHIYIQLINIIPNYVSLVLDWYNSNENGEILDIWLIAIQQNENEVLTWIQDQIRISPTMVRLIIKIVNPNSKNVVKKGASLWMPFLETSSNNKTIKDIEIHVFLTAIAFNFKDEYALKLLKKSFMIVYKAIADNNLDYSLMYPVLYHTKPLFWQEWDKCKKLRNALADKFNQAGWDYSEIQEIVKNDSLAKEIKWLCHSRINLK